MTVLLVAICCFIISNSQYFLSSTEKSSDGDNIEYSQHSGDDDQDNQTFLDVATDAVMVPFASLVAESTMKLIYEIIGFEEQRAIPQATMARYPSHFLEVLLEQIVAPNAP
ncbi:hypothetical protein [Echinicola rosea]|uniref:Uncharacterized protein n=1 Tax=Echinicola rosea TaxID=1807691 RepID=A0ABQ1V0K4_9BACT|nr:hypothetical protein [Echinicola rosea]GGF33203.1 hypothetical protein GCM10011339_21740 [Echinicola rosea]